MKRLGIVVQARMSSARLPGKSLHKVNGRPLLDYLVRRLKNVDFTPEESNDVWTHTIILATSDQASDVPIADYAKDSGVNVYQGSLNDVASRFVNVARHYHLDAIVRLSGDSPLLDPTIIEEAFRLYQTGHFQLVTNIGERTFPHGQSVELFNAAWYEYWYPHFETPSDYEHVTPFFYRKRATSARPYRIQNFPSNIVGDDINRVGMAIDTAEDLERFRAVLKLMDRPPETYGLIELLDFYRQLDH